MSKRLIASLIAASALSVPVLADDGTSGQSAPSAAGPRDGTGPENVQGQPGSGSNTSSDRRMLSNRDDSQSRSMSKGDADSKTDAILDKIKSSPDKANEKLFVLEAAMGNQWEIELSRVAQEKAQDKQVKDLAKMIMNEHQQAQTKLMAIAKQWDMDLPTSLPPGKQKKLDVFSSLPADKFDSSYVLMLKTDHAKDITSYADHQVALQDETIKGYIGEVLPKLKQHGQRVMQVAKAKKFGADDIALGGVSSDSGAMGNTDQSQSRDLNDTHGNHDSSDKPADANSPR